MTKELKIEGYCLKCKEKREMVNPQAEWAANGSPATRGTCPVCGANMYKRGHTAAHDNLPKPEIEPRPKKQPPLRKRNQPKRNRRRKSQPRKRALPLTMDRRYAVPANW
ncbi:MAG: DUF5679 domain-containing protein [Chloroflexi bacterium]|nr:DUF5679 domain-containing protein [Chloroflexota bacterium]